MRAERLHAEQSREQKSLQAETCVWLEKEPSDEEQAVSQATNVSQPTENVISLPSNDKSFLIKIRVKAYILIKSVRILRWMVLPRTWILFFFSERQILGRIVIT